MSHFRMGKNRDTGSGEVNGVQVPVDVAELSQFLLDSRIQIRD